MPLEALRSEALRLQTQWRDVLNKRESVRTPSTLLEDLPLAQRLLREVRGDLIQKIFVDDESLLTTLRAEAERRSPQTSGAHLEAASPDLWEKFAILKQLDAALERRIDLPSGGYLVVDEREAMTTIDVNTGSAVGDRSVEDTVFQVNMEAAKACARLLRLRNLGGIVVVDFIDMESSEHQESVRHALLGSIRNDAVPTFVGDFTELGLLCITRERRSPSLLRQSSLPCPQCSGSGWRRSSRFLMRRALEDVLGRVRRCPSRLRGVRLRVPAALAEHTELEETQEILHRTEEAARLPIEIQRDCNVAEGFWRIDLLS